MSEIRRRAEAFLQDSGATGHVDPALEEPRQILHELQVHQVELEMQNEELRKAQQQLEESRKKFEDLYDFAPVGYLTCDPTGMIRECNLTLADMLECDRRELLRLPLTKHLMPDEHGEVFARLRKAASGGKNVVWESRMLRRSGEVFDVSIEAAVIRGDDAEPRFRVVVSDISDRKQAERLLRQSESRYRMLADHASDMICHLRLDGCLLYVSPASQALLGRSAESLTGANLLDLVHTQDRARFQLAIDQTAKERTVLPFEYRIRRRDGSTLWVESTAKGLSLQRDGTAELVLSLRDISSRKAAEEAVLHTEKSLRSVMDAMVEGCMLLDRDGHILYANEVFSGFTQRPLKNLQGYKVEEVFSDNQACPFAQLLRDCPGTEQAFRREVECICAPDAPTQVLEVSIQPLNDGRLFVLSIDITERRREMEERIEFQSKILETQKLESLGVMASGIAHDFNNILMSILGNAELLQMDLEEGSTEHESAVEIEGAARRAADLSAMMLAYSGHGRFRSVTTPLGRQVLELRPMLESLLSRKVPLVCEIAEPDSPVRLDVSQLRQLLMALVANAQEAVGEGGEIRLSVRAVSLHHAEIDRLEPGGEGGPGDYALIEVRDNGCGIEAKDLPRIFDPFYTTKFLGRGLGLSAVFGIVRGHGGLLHVHSRPGEGSRFAVFLPRQTESAGEEDGAGELLPEGWQGEGLIFLVDDEEAVRSGVRRLLERAGFRVLTASDGSQALGLFREHRGEIRCVLLDMHMPYMGGVEAFGRLREIDPDTPIILSSGYSEENLAEHFSDRRPQGFIKKPYRFQELMGMLYRVLED